MSDLKYGLMDLVTHLNTEKIIEVDRNIFDDKTIYESVKMLKEIFKNRYPETKLKPMMKSIHYANGFEDGSLKQTAYILDEIEQYLTINKFLNHDRVVQFFNNKITTKDFLITPENLVETSIESLLLAKNSDL